MKKVKKVNKTIGVTIRFFTNGLPEKTEKNNSFFWTCGVALLEANKEKGIKSQSTMFNYFDEIPAAIKNVLSKGKLIACEDVGYVERAKARKLKK